MKKQLKYCLLMFVLWASCITGCKKADTPVIAGHTYTVQRNVFNTGAWQPMDTLYAYRVYFNAGEGLNYCDCGGPGQGDLHALKGAKIDSLNGTVLWHLPTDDLQ
jgi:hypothetical protein